MKELRIIPLQCSYSELICNCDCIGEGSSSVVMKNTNNNFILKAPRFFKKGQFLDFIIKRKGNNFTLPSLAEVDDYAAQLEEYLDGFGVIWGQLLAQIAFWNEMAQLAEQDDEEALQILPLLAPLQALYLTSDGVLVVKQEYAQHIRLWRDSDCYTNRMEILKQKTQDEGLIENLRRLSYSPLWTFKQRKSYMRVVDWYNNNDGDYCIYNLSFENLGFVGDKCKILDWGINNYFNINDYDTSICDYGEDEEDYYLEDYGN